MAMKLEMVAAQILACAEGRSLSPMRSELAAWADAITAHLTQPAQAVDVGAIREVIADMRNTTEIWPVDVDRWALAITRALSGERAVWREVSDPPKDAPPHSLSLLVYLPEFGWRRGFYTRPYHHANKSWWPWEAAGFTKRESETITHWMPLPASPTPDKETQQ